MEIQSRHLELSVISQVSAVEECPLVGFHCSCKALIGVHKIGGQIHPS